jgi:hypothetical protein
MSDTEKNQTPVEFRHKGRLYVRAPDLFEKLQSLWAYGRDGRVPERQQLLDIAELLDSIDRAGRVASLQ